MFTGLAPGVLLDPEQTPPEILDEFVAIAVQQGEDMKEQGVRAELRKLLD